MQYTIPCLAGEMSSSGNNVAEVLTRSMDGDFTPLDHVAIGLPPQLVRMVHALLWEEPEQRPGDAELVASELEEFSSKLGWQW